MMYLYFDEAALVAVGGSVKTVRYGKRGEEYDKKVLEFQHHTFEYNEGRPYSITSCALANYELPQELQGGLIEVSYYDNFGYNFCPQRQLGFYRYKSATANLEEIGGKDCHYYAKFLGKDVEDVKKLYFLLREGKIWPAIDYEKAQVPPPARHLRQLGQEAWALIRREVSDRLYHIRLHIQNHIGQ